MKMCTLRTRDHYDIRITQSVLLFERFYISIHKNLYFDMQLNICLFTKKV